MCEPHAAAGSAPGVLDRPVVIVVRRDGVLSVRGDGGGDPDARPVCGTATAADAAFLVGLFGTRGYAELAGRSVVPDVHRAKTDDEAAAAIAETAAAMERAYGRLLARRAVARD